VLWHARVLCGWAARREVLSEHGAGSGEHEDKHSRRCRAPIVDKAAMSLVGLLGIWRGRRGITLLCARRDLRADTVDGATKGRRGGTWAWGKEVVRVNPHMQRQACTPMALKKHRCIPTRTHLFRHAPA